MRIKSIHIKGLFNTFDHFIPFNQEDRITIIHAPNGFGKTIILKMLYGLLKMDFSIFEKISFESFVVNLDNKSKIEIKRLDTTKKENSKYYSYTIYFKKKNKEKENLYTKSKLEKVDNEFGFDFIQGLDEEKLDNLKLFNPKLIALDNFELRNRGLDTSDWYKNLQKEISVHLIETQRTLMVDKEKIDDNRYFEKSDNVLISSVSKYTTELKDIIENTLNDYATTSQNLERTFPNRLITQQKQENLTIENIKNELNNLEERRKKLQEVGLWDKDNSQDMNFEIPENTDSSSLNVLNLYIQDAKEKLAAFDGLEQKIALFKNIINSRFQFKQIYIDKKKGFFFLTHKNENLDSNDLSSGEQHQLVLLYEMLFKVKKNDLVLLDQPEISLHIVWQEKFLYDLVKIIELNPFDVVITTHAPEIINDRWDLSIGLSKNKENA